MTRNQIRFSLRSTMRLTALLASAALLPGCNKVAEAPTTTPAPAVQEPVLKLPVSLNAVMVALVDHSMRPIWSAADKAPTTEADWSSLEYHAYQVMIAGTLIRIPGTGPADAGWVAQPEFQQFAQQLTDEGSATLAAVKRKDLPAIVKLGNEVVATCEACHAKFKPEIPTGKIMLRYP
jgi:hypothetical protein